MNKKLLQRSFNLVNILNRILKEKNLIIPNQFILLAISGGQDSSCLLMIFFQIRIQWNLKLSIVYCNHFWQKDSFYGMKNIFNLMFSFKLCTYFSLSLRNLKTEQEARLWRYFCYERISCFYNIQTIATGHTGSDKLETFLFNLFRGTSPQGIISLNWQKYITFNKFKLFFYNICDKKYGKKILISCPKVYVSFQKTPINLKFQQIENKLKQNYKLSKSHFRLHSNSATNLIYLTKKNKIYKKKNKLFKKNYLLNSQIFVTKFKKFFCLSYEKNSQQYYNSQLIFVNKSKSVFFYLRKFYIKNSIFCKIKITLNQKINYQILLNLNANFIFFYCFSKASPAKRIKVLLSFARAKLINVFLNRYASQAKSFYKFKKIKIYFSSEAKPIVASLAERLLHKSSAAREAITSYNHKNSSSFKKISLIRPFLYLTRTDVNKLSNFWEIPVYPDKSNQFLNYSRNRIRKQILPTLRFFFNPQIDNILYQFNDISDLEQNFLSSITNQLILEARIQNEKINLFRTSILKFLPVSLQRRIIRQYLENFFKKKIKFHHIDAILQIIAKNNQQNFKQNFLLNSNVNKILKKKKLKNFLFII